MMLLLIRSLEIGGAERQFVSLAKGLHDKGIQLNVLTFYRGGALRTELEHAGVPVTDLNKRGRRDLVGFLWRLVSAVIICKPSTIYAFLPTANILAVVLGILLGPKVVWGIRASNVDLTQYDWLSRIVSVLEKWSSARADLIICNSTAGLEYHANRGFPCDKMVVIHNGIDTDRFRRDQVSRVQCRTAFDVGDNDILVGIAAMIDPMKDYPTFLRAASVVAAANENVRFVCVGDGDPAYRELCEELVVDLGLSMRLTWTGPRTDMPTIYSAFDIAVSSSSFGEGFSNSIGEAMACECPCVVTDVGDSALIVGDTGLVVPPGNSEMLADSIMKFVKSSQYDRMQIGHDARERIVTNFSLQYMIERTASYVT